MIWYTMHCEMILTFRLINTSSWGQVLNFVLLFSSYFNISESHQEVYDLSLFSTLVQGSLLPI